MAATTEDPDDLKRQVEYLEAHYRRLVESISEGVSVVTLDGIVASLSPAFESLTGWTPSQLIGSYVQSLIHPVDLPLTIELYCPPEIGHVAKCSIIVHEREESDE
jgi:PAS domain-containing protein